MARLSSGFTASAVARPLRPQVVVMSPAYSGVPGGQVGIIGGPQPARAAAVVSAPQSARPPLEPPLRVRSVTLPPSGIVYQGGVTFFRLDVHPEDGGAPWAVLRRYNHFADLESSLGGWEAGITGAPFPRKHLTACTGEKLEARRRGLEAWLHKVLGHPNSGGLWAGALRNFLENDRFVAPQPQVAAVQPAGAPQGFQARPSPTAPPPSLPPSPAPAASGPVGAGAAEEEQLLQLTVPKGVGPGQAFAVQVPGGAHLPLTVPEAAQPGDVMHVRYDPSRGSLSIVAA